MRSSKPATGNRCEPTPSQELHKKKVGLLGKPWAVPLCWTAAKRCKGLTWHGADALQRPLHSGFQWRLRAGSFAFSSGSPTATDAAATPAHACARPAHGLGVWRPLPPLPSIAPGISIAQLTREMSPARDRDAGCNQRRSSKHDSTVEPFAHEHSEGCEFHKHQSCSGARP